jgi:hypothetical protein
MKKFIKKYNSPYWNKKFDKASSLAFKNIQRVFVPATEKQRNYLRILGYQDYSSISLSKDKAMEEISKRIADKPAGVSL